MSVTVLPTLDQRVDEIASTAFVDLSREELIDYVSREWRGNPPPADDIGQALDRRDQAFHAQIERNARRNRAAQANEPANGQAPPPPSPTLIIEDYRDVRARVAAAPDPGWLARPVYPADAHGVIGAEDKAGKTWMALDLGVAKATGNAWLGHWPTEAPGRVLAFLGEGGERKMDRRIDAIRAFYEADPDELERNLRLCFRAPMLTKIDHLAAIDAELAAHKPALTILDPLYLSAGGANTASLTEMGQHLGAIQALTQRHGSALLIVTHWNQTGTGKGRGRFTGAGPAEWGRVTMSVSVADRRTNGDKSIVKLEAEIVGDEVPDTALTFTRTVWADDPDDLRSPLHYEVAIDATTHVELKAWEGPTECIAALRSWWAGQPASIELSQTAASTQFRAHQEAAGGPKWRAETVRSSLEILAAKGDLAVRNGPRNSRLFQRPEEDHELF